MEIRDIYIYLYVCMYVCIVFFLYGTFRSRTRLLIPLTVHDKQHISRSGVALLNAYCTQALWNKRKQIKEKAGMGERSQTVSVGIQKRRSKVGDKNNLKL